METTWRWTLVTAIAPIAWGTNYYVTHRYLPAGFPLWGGAIRALPAGLLLLLVTRRLPRGSWWWRSLVLGVLNVASFFVLIYVAAQSLPTSIASTIMATSPIVLMLSAWAALSERPRIAHLTGAAIGVVGVALMLLGGPAKIDFWGVGASVAAMVMSSFGYVLAKKWSAGLDVLSLTAWQLIAGGLVLVPVGFAVEGPSPALGLQETIAFLYVGVVATALAYVAWFTGLRHLTAGTVGLIGLLNPVAGVLLGVLVAGELLSLRQIGGLLLVFLGVLLGQPPVTQAVRRPIIARAAAVTRGRS